MTGADMCDARIRVKGSVMVREREVRKYKGA